MNNDYENPPAGRVGKNQSQNYTKNDKTTTIKPQNVLIY